jgi:hypothetical protein
MADMPQQPSGRPSVDPKQIDALQRALLAAKKFVYSPQTNKYAMEELRKPGSPPHVNAGRGAARIMALVMSKSNGAMAPEIMFSAGYLLLADIIKFMQETGANISEEQKREAGIVYTQTMAEMFPGQQQGA